MNNIYDKLPISAKTAVQKIEDSGFLVYPVGGCVRSILMGSEPNDIDITTSAKPNEICEIFSDYILVKNGEKYGTITVIIDKEPIEITTMRSDVAYTDGRRPTAVVFTDDIYLDLMRRDFTINAIAVSSKSEIIDPSGGQSDIKNRVIRAVGNPTERFLEDGLRIMRAVRFASSLTFEIEENTVNAMLVNIDTLDKIARERICSELSRVMCGENVVNTLRNYFDIFCKIIPELIPLKNCNQHSKYHKYDVWEHTLRVVGHTDADLIMRLAALLHDIAKPPCRTIDELGRGHFYHHEIIGEQMSREILGRLRFKNSIISNVCQMVRYHRDDRAKDKLWVKNSLRNLGGAQAVRQILAIMRADAKAKVEAYRDVDEIEQAEQILIKIINNDEPYSLAQLAVKGNDLSQLNIENSQIGRVLNKLLDYVIQNPKENKREILLNLVSKYIPKA